MVLQTQEGLSPQAQPLRTHPDSRLMWSQIALVLHFVQVQARGRELGDLVTSPGPDLHIEYLSADHAADCALIHVEDASPPPIPALVVVASIDADQDFHFRLAPEPWIVGPSQVEAEIKVGALILAIGA